MPGKVKGSSKRFDQKQQSHYEKLSAQDQKDYDQTYVAIRFIEASSDEESKKFLKTYKLKYTHSRKWAVFLDIFVNMAWYNKHLFFPELSLTLYQILISFDKN